MRKLSKSEVTRIGLCSLQVCVPKNYTDQQVTDFANRDSPTGISSKWIIRKEGNPDLQNDPERQQCNERPDFVHIMLDC